MTLRLLAVLNAQVQSCRPVLGILAPHTWTAKVTKCRCILGVMLKLPAVGFMAAAYWQFWISLSRIFCLSYLGAAGD